MSVTLKQLVGMCRVLGVALLIGGGVCWPVQAADDAPGAKPVVLESRTSVRMMNWTSDGNVLVFGGELKGSEPDSGIEARFLKQAQTIRVRGMDGADRFTVALDSPTVIFAERVAETRAEFRFVDIKSGEKQRMFDIDVRHRLFAPQALVCSSDGSKLACVGLSGTPTIEPDSDNVESRILILDLKTGKLLADLIERDDVINTAAFSPDGSRLVTGHNVVDMEEPGVRVWDVEKGTLEKAWPAKRRSVTGLAVSPDGKYVASVGYTSKLPKDGDDFAGGEWDRFVSVHDIQTGELVQNFKGHTESPRRVAFSKDGLIASGGADKTVRIWKVGADEPVHTLTGPTSSVHAVTFAPDGSKLAAGESDQKVHIWDLASFK